MNETITTITGNLVDQPLRRRLESGVSVTSFRVASNARRYDKVIDRWVDGDSLYLRVTCWRGLAENVERSVVKGDPVLVTGKLYTRMYDAGEGQRASYELEATAVGFNLAKGTAQFSRAERLSGATTDEVGEDGLPTGQSIEHHLDEHTVQEEDRDELDELDEVESLEGEGTLIEAIDLTETVPA
jgi:single-strand DNA-binding protein